NIQIGPSSHDSDANTAFSTDCIRRVHVSRPVRRCVFVARAITVRQSGSQTSSHPLAPTWPNVLNDARSAYKPGTDAVGSAKPIAHGMCALSAKPFIDGCVPRTPPLWSVVIARTEA